MTYYGDREAWVSTCGDYVAIYWGRHVMAVDVLHRDGRIWRARRYQPTCCADQNPRFVYAEFPRMVTSWCIGNRAVGSFSVTFADFDQSVPLRCPHHFAASNSLRAVFRRRVPPLRPAVWIRHLIDTYEEATE